MWKALIFLSLVAAGSNLAGAQPAKTGTYANPEFGLSVRIPEGLRCCTGEGATHSHGPVIFLDPHDVGSCDYQQRRRAVLFYSSYSVTDETKTLDDLRRWCVNMFGGKEVRAPKGIRIPGCKTASARVDLDDGWIDVYAVTQMAPGATANPLAPSVNHTIRLHTDPAHLEGDLAVFRSVLKSTKLSPTDGS